MRSNLRNFGLWVVIVLLLLALFTVFQNPQQRAAPPLEIAFAQLLADADQGRIRRAVVEGSDVQATYADGHAVKARAPGDLASVQLLVGKVATIAAQSPQDQDRVRWWMSLAGAWLPFIALIGVWMVISRRRQAFDIRGFGFGEGAASAALRDDPDSWRDCARAARAGADQLADPQSRRQMLEIARSYEYLAQRAEERVRGSDNPR